jgi:hypothetical protein
MQCQNQMCGCSYMNALIPIETPPLSLSDNHESIITTPTTIIIILIIIRLNCMLRLHLIYSIILFLTIYNQQKKITIYYKNYFFKKNTKILYFSFLNKYDLFFL